MAGNKKLPEPVTSTNCVGDVTARCPLDKKALLQILVGGPYERHGETHPYGHVAVRVKKDAKDFTYDYGRYGAVWGIGDSKGEGMLRVWTDYAKYIAGENATGRTTQTYNFEITETEAEKVISHFSAKTAGKTLVQDRGHMKQYHIEDYDALRSNCTTVSVDGAKVAKPSLMVGSEKYNTGSGLSTSEKLAAKVAGWPDRIFMPADLGAFLGTVPRQEGGK